MAPFRILSLDGGGIRGIIPALVLAEIEQRTGKRTAELFDLIAGTSTGGILALGLTRPGPAGRPLYTANEMVSLYREDGSKIFPRPRFGPLRAIKSVFDEKYSSRGVDAVLKARFGEAWLSEAVTPVLVTAYDLEGRQPYFFKSRRAKGEQHYDHLMRNVARATSAAPTYFEPAKLPVGDNPKGYVALVDGGVYANNPAACALVESICFLDQKLDDVIMLSLGTGEFTKPILYDDARNWGLAKWVRPILDVVFDGVSDTVNYQVSSLVNREAAGQHLRIQTVVGDKNDAMDDASADNLAGLSAAAAKVIAKHSGDLDAFLAHLTGTVPPRAQPIAPAIPPISVARDAAVAIPPPQA